MTPALWIAALWLAFATTHTVPSSAPLRVRLVGALGSGPYQGLYSLVALATFVPLCWVYFTNRHVGPLLWTPGSPGFYWVSLLVAGAGFTLLVASFFQPSPFSMTAAGTARPRGLLTITRHPLFFSLSLLAAGHLLLSGWLTDVLFFGGLALYSLLGALHQDSRKRQLEGERFEAFLAETSLVPFVAILAGRAKLSLSELPWLGLLIGAAAALGIYRLHFVVFA